MRLTFPYQTDRLGAVRIYGLQHVFELDSGSAPGGGEGGPSWGTTVSHVPAETLRSVHREMAVVVPCRDERLKLLEGILAGIPHDCLIILVSNTGRDPVDRYSMEQDSLDRFCRFNQRSAIVVHQRDPGVAAAFRAAGMAEIIDDQGLVRHGKGEGMILGLALAKLAGRRSVGFVDADNYVPGSVTEYVNAYAADLHLSHSRYAMVRIAWFSKPKVMDGSIFFSRSGRTSEVTNRFLNLLIGYHTGFGSDAIRTGNAGEHAMTMDLALKLRLAGGFAIEPFEFIEMLERFGGVTPGEPAVGDVAVMREGVEVFQVETRNPHFHEDKGDEHVKAMRYDALGAIYHSPACVPRLREELVEFVAREAGHTEPLDARPVLYPPLESLDWAAFARVLSEEAPTFRQVVHPGPESLLGRSPLPIEIEDR